MITMINKFFRLSYVLAHYEFISKHEGTLLGILWYLISPFLTFLLLYFIFQRNLGLAIDHYAAYLLIGVITFNFFKTITIESVAKVRQKAGLIKAVSFPREVLIGSVVIKTLLAHCFEITIATIILSFLGISWTQMIYYPIVLFVLAVFSFGVALILAALFIYFFDLEYIWSFLVQLLFFASPIFYQIETHSSLYLLNLFNPLYFFMNITREVIINQTIPAFWMISGGVGYSVISLALGLLVFGRVKKQFPEYI